MQLQHTEGVKDTPIVKRILVVEDDPANAEMLMLAIEQEPLIWFS